MVRMKMLVAMVALAGAAVAGTATPAAARPGADCNGAVDAGCTYCGHWSGSGNAYPYSYCYNNPGSYRFQTCGVWVSGRCQVG